MKRKPNNPRQISKREFERLAADLERFGDLGGVVHNETTGNFVGGNQRSSVFELERQGAQITVTETYAEPTRAGTVARGYVEWRGERYDYRRVRWDTETEDAACLVANLRGGSWDFDALSAWDGDLLQGIGFDGDLLAAWNDQAANLRELLESEKPAPVEDAGAQVDKAEELREKWGVETGQLWQLGEHRLICGDCTDKAVVEKVMEGEKAALTLTDPPYGIDVVPDSGEIGWSTKQAKVSKFSKVINDDKLMDVSFLLDTADKVAIFGGQYFAHYLPKAGRWLVWDKDFTDAERDFVPFSECELVWSNIPGVAVKKYKCRSMGYSREGETGSREHPNQKPIIVISGIIDDFSKAEEMVYDPFLGSGTTLIACERLGRKCRAVEISPAYVAVAIQRWVDVTGGEPVLLQ